jgi:ABC-2 type transport system ATP-binding protein
MSHGLESPTDVPALAATQLSKRFNTRAALNGLDISVPAGSVTGLVGPNGAGKTTLMRAWLAFERPDSGSVAVAGVDPWRNRSRALRGIGYVPQSPAIYSGLSVDDQLRMARGLRGDFDADYARRRLDQLGIPLGQRAETLSGGQAAQLGLAVALGTRAKILMLDEPLASLDPLARREFVQVLLEAVRADGLTVLLSSHIVTDVEDACDRLAVLGNGKVLLDSALDVARLVHQLTDSEAAPDGATLVGSFKGNGNNRTMRLWRQQAPTGAPPVGTSPWGASLEDVVLGYLAAGRGAIAEGR